MALLAEGSHPLKPLWFLMGLLAKHKIRVCVCVIVMCGVRCRGVGWKTRPYVENLLVPHESQG